MVVLICLSLFCGIVYSVSFCICTFPLQGGDLAPVCIAGVRTECRIMPVLKTRMYEFRKETGLQQSEPAELAGVRRETIGKPENGKYNQSSKLAMDIAKVFGRAVEDVFMFEEDE